MTVIVDYDMGNVRSVAGALGRIGEECCLSSDPEVIMKADRVILPGVGAADTAMRNIRGRGLERIIPGLRCPVLGICIGMQIMCRHSEEGDAECLGIFDSEVVRLRDAFPEGASTHFPKGEDSAHFPEGRLKIPHTGWDSIRGCRGPLTEGVPAGSHVYYVHSFAPEVCAQTAAVTEYGMEFSAVLMRGNFYGTQFHPEKSGGVGELIIRNFVNL